MIDPEWPVWHAIKVVRRGPTGRLFGAAEIITEVEYWQDRPSEPEMAGTKLFVFEYVEDAQQFAGYQFTDGTARILEIWSCLAWNMKPAPDVIFALTATVTRHMLATYWQNDPWQLTLGDLENHRLRGTPQGSFVVDAVQLVEMLYRDCTQFRKQGEPLRLWDTTRTSTASSS